MNTEKLKRLIITCGGTGGHFYPGLSIAREFQAHGGEVMLLLGGNNVEKQTQIAQSFQINAIALKPMPSPNSWRKKIKFISGCLSGIWRSYQEIRKFKPDAVLGMGSFASLPPLLAAKLCHVPIFLHDGNARIGKANRIFSRFSRHLSSAFPAVNHESIKCHYSCNGMPLRQELFEHKLSHEDAIKALNAKFGSDLSSDGFTILIFGGSQGARTLNRVVPDALSALIFGHFQVIHLTGSAMYEEVKNFYAEHGINSLVLSSSDCMDLFYEASDLVISRSGGSSVAELLAFGKYAVLVPYPYAAELHQNDNAQYMADLGSAVIVDDLSATADKIKELLETLLIDIPLLKEKGRRACNLDAPYVAQVQLKLMDDALASDLK